MKSSLIALLITFPTAVVFGQQGDFAPKPIYTNLGPTLAVESLAGLQLPNTTIESSVVEGDGSCRVTAVVTHPPANDHVRIYIALPLTHWNGRFYGTGGAGFSGGSTFNLAGPVQEGFATGATDTGHPGESGSFALDTNGHLDLQAVEDNAYQGIHDMTVVGKAVATAFYGKPPRYSYFNGFSTGGRQGLMEAQRYPEDYDGVVAGCPAIDLAQLEMASLWPQVVMAASSNRPSFAKMRAATKAAVASCDAADGVKDGIIEDPSSCHYDPAALVGTQIGGSVFTQADADVIRKIWDGPRTKDGAFLWYGLSRGANLSDLAAPGPFPIALDWVRYFVMQNPRWSFAKLTPENYEAVFKQSVDQFGKFFATDDPDLSRFRDHGGKLILLHGQADQLIMTQATVDYYQRVLKKMGGRDKVLPFARLFLIPGAGHGNGGVVGLDEAIVSWVEDGSAPQKLINRGPGLRTRPIFPYPELARYKGKGSTDDADNFQSVLPQ